MEQNKLVQYQKFMPPTAVWTVIFLLAGWAINTFVPPEYQTVAYGLWSLLAFAAGFVGVSMQKVVDLGATVGIEIKPPPGAMGDVQSVPVMPKPAQAAEQHKLRRWIGV